MRTLPRISTTGKLNSSSYNNKGFTLIELIVVIIIMSVLLVFAMPRMSGFIFQDDTDQMIRWLVIKARSLRNRAVEQQKDYFLNIDIDNSRLWVTDETIDTEEAMNKASENGFSLPESVVIRDVVYPGIGKALQGTVVISFRKQGYADQAVIHIRDQDDRNVSLMVEAFLPSVRWVEDYAETYR